jgi:hypothetical protein
MSAIQFAVLRADLDRALEMIHANAESEDVGM